MSYQCGVGRLGAIQCVVGYFVCVELFLNFFLSAVVQLDGVQVVPVRSSRSGEIGGVARQCPAG
jgi:hypothetical protein